MGLQVNRLADGTPVHGEPVGEREATEVADAQRAVANMKDPKERAQAMRDADPDDDALYVDAPLWRTEDGELVPQGSADGVSLAYAAGDKVTSDDDRERIGKMKPDADDDDAPGKAAPKAGVKAAAVPANKAAPVRNDK